MTFCPVLEHPEKQLLVDGTPYPEYKAVTAFSVGNELHLFNIAL